MKADDVAVPTDDKPATEPEKSVTDAVDPVDAGDAIDEPEQATEPTPPSTTTGDVPTAPSTEQPSATDESATPPVEPPTSQARTLETDLFNFMGFGGNQQEQPQPSSSSQPRPEEPVSTPVPATRTNTIDLLAGASQAAAATAAAAAMGIGTQSIDAATDSKKTTDATDTDGQDEQESGEKLVPASVLDQFALQIQRLEEHHANELQQTEQRHQRELEDLTASFQRTNAKEKADLENDLQAQVREKELQVQDLLKTREGMRLKMDVLQRELDGTSRLLQERDTAIGSASQEHSSRVYELESLLKKATDEAGVAKADVHNLKVCL